MKNLRNRITVQLINKEKTIENVHQNQVIRPTKYLTII